MISMRKQLGMGITAPDSNSQASGPSGIGTSHGFGRSRSVPAVNGYEKMPSSMDKIAISQPSASPTRSPIAKRYPKSAINAMNPNLNANPEPV